MRVYFSLKIPCGVDLHSTRNIKALGGSAVPQRRETCRNLIDVGYRIRLGCDEARGIYTPTPRTDGQLCCEAPKCGNSVSRRETFSTRSVSIPKYPLHRSYLSPSDHSTLKLSANSLAASRETAKPPTEGQRNATVFEFHK